MEPAPQNTLILSGAAITTSLFGQVGFAKQVPLQMPRSFSIPKPPPAAKKRAAAARAQVADARNRVTVALPALLTVAEVAAALRVSKPTVTRLVRRGELATYRPNGLGGVLLVIGDSVAAHVARNTYGGDR